MSEKRIYAKGMLPLRRTDVPVCERKKDSRYKEDGDQLRSTAAEPSALGASPIHLAADLVSMPVQASESQFLRVSLSLLSKEDHKGQVNSTDPQMHGAWSLG